MKVIKSVAAIGLAASLFSSTITSAAEIRSGSALPRTHVAHTATPVAASKDMDQQNDLLGTPLFLLFLGAVAVTVGTIVIVNNASNG